MGALRPPGGVVDGPVDFTRRLGEQLRKVRRQKGLSLLDVEAASSKEFKASVLGAYERGERAITAGRLARLAEIYRVPLVGLLPEAGEHREAGDALADGLALDLRRLREVDSSEGRALLAYVRTLQELRGDWGTEVISIRGSDLRAIASVLEIAPTELIRRIEELGLRVR